MAIALLALHLLDMEEEEDAEETTNMRVSRRRLRDQQNPFDLTEREFRTLFRISRDLAKDVIDDLRPNLECQRSDGLSAETIVLCAVRFYAVGSYQRAVGQDFMIALCQASVSNCIKKVTVAINNHLLRQWVKFPATAEERATARKKFLEAPQPFPGAIGAIDCTHIAIVAPKENEEAFVNHKGFHSLNVQMICDPDLKFINVNARHPGSRHDSAIWMQSPVRDFMEMWYKDGERKTWLLGDSGYPLEPWILTPITEAPVGTPDFRYTEGVCKARCIIERAYGLLKSVFRCLSKQRMLMYHPDVAGRIVNACVVLHNMRLHYKVDDVPAEDEIPNDQADVAAAPMVNFDGGARFAEGRRVRTQVIHDYFTY